jgi:hypothetical protein
MRSSVAGVAAATGRVPGNFTLGAANTPTSEPESAPLIIIEKIFAGTPPPEGAP